MKKQDKRVELKSKTTYPWISWIFFMLLQLIFFYRYTYINIPSEFNIYFYGTLIKFKRILCHGLMYKNSS